MPYSSINPEDIEVLRGIVGEDRIFTGEAINEDYGHDELGFAERMPDVLLKVTTTGEVAAVMKHAHSRHIPVVVRGSGTGLVGGAVPIEGGILLETTLMNQILELDTDNLTVTVQPGVLLMDLAEFAIENDFLYPPDPGEKSATIGGNISTNAGGMRAVKYGVTRDYVRGLTAVMPNGEILTLGGKVAKNSSGYSIKDLLIGSEGTLGIITEAILKLVPLPAYSVSLLVSFSTMEAALEMVPRIIKSKTAPTAIEYMSRETILFAEEYLGRRFPDTRYPAYILLTYDGNGRRQVEEQYTIVADLCLEHGAEDVLIVDTDERKDSVWKARGAFLEAIKSSTTQMDECDVVVPCNRIADYIRYTHKLAKDIGLRIPSFGHAGDGNLHIYLCRDQLDDEVWEQRMSDTFDLMYKKAYEMGGLVSGEHGVGYAKKAYLSEHGGEEQIQLMRNIKHAFDPQNILNPGKVCQ